MLDIITTQGASLLGPAWPVVWTLVKIVALVLPLMICVAYLTLWERVGIGYTQIRLGPNRVGPRGWLQPIADAVKLIFKEIILPTAANHPLFLLGPVMTIMPALAAWAVVPFGPEVALSNINAGLLFLMARPVLQDAIEAELFAAFPTAEVILHQEPAGVEDARLDHRIAATLRPAG